jgi:osmotically-inducible protein OsmY
VFLLSLSLSAQPARSDIQIEAQIKTKLAKSLIGKDGFTFRVKDGVVYWEGSTTVPQHKGSATRMAKSAGAKRVVNQIRVAGAKTPGKSATSAATSAAAKSPVQEPAAKSAPPVNVSNPAPPASPKRATVHWVPAQ